MTVIKSAREDENFNEKNFIFVHQKMNPLKGKTKKILRVYS